MSCQMPCALCVSEDLTVYAGYAWSQILIIIVCRLQRKLAGFMVSISGHSNGAAGHDLVVASKHSLTGRHVGMGTPVKPERSPRRRLQANWLLPRGTDLWDSASTWMHAFHT